MQAFFTYQFFVICSAAFYYAVFLFITFRQMIVHYQCHLSQKVEHGMQMPNDVQLPRNEVIHHVSSILEDSGFGPAGEDIDIGNLYPFCTFLVDLFVYYNFTYNYMIIVFIHLFLLLVCEAPAMNKCQLTNMVCQCLCCLFCLFQDL